MKRTKFPQTNIIKHLKMIKKIAWSFHLSTGLDYDDLFQEACLIWLDNSCLWNPGKGKITTFMWCVITGGLRNWLKKDKRYSAPLEEMSKKADRPVYQVPYYELLSVEASAIAEIIVLCPDKFASSPKPEVINRVERIMVNNGWNLGAIKSGVRHLETVFS